MPRRLTEIDLLEILARPGYALGSGTPPRLDPDIPEKLFLGKVRALAVRHGWIYYHTYDSRKSEQGFPDLVLARTSTATSPGRLIFAELKRGKNKPTAAQETWLSVLAHTVPGVEVYLWTPADLETIADILAARLGKVYESSLT